MWQADQVPEEWYLDNNIPRKFWSAINVINTMLKHLFPSIQSTIDCQKIRLALFHWPAKGNIYIFDLDTGCSPNCSPKPGEEWGWGGLPSLTLGYHRLPQRNGNQQPGHAAVWWSCLGETGPATACRSAAVPRSLGPLDNLRRWRAFCLWADTSVVTFLANSFINQVVWFVSLPFTVLLAQLSVWLSKPGLIIFVINSESISLLITFLLTSFYS